MFSMENILDKLIERNKKVSEELETIKKINWSNINSSKELMSDLFKISNNLNILENNIEEFNDIVLENTINPNREELRKIREMKINKYIEKKFFPLIIYLRLCIENNIVDID